MRTRHPRPERALCVSRPSRERPVHAQFFERSLLCCARPSVSPVSESSDSDIPHRIDYLVRYPCSVEHLHLSAVVWPPRLEREILSSSASQRFFLYLFPARMGSAQFMPSPVGSAASRPLAQSGQDLPEPVGPDLGDQPNCSFSFFSLRRIIFLFCFNSNLSQILFQFDSNLLCIPTTT